MAPAHQPAIKKHKTATATPGYQTSVIQGQPYASYHHPQYQSPHPYYAPQAVPPQHPAQYRATPGGPPYHAAQPAAQYQYGYARAPAMQQQPVYQQPPPHAPSQPHAANSTKQYYQNTNRRPASTTPVPPAPKKISVTPPVATSKLSNHVNKLPNPILVKLMAAEEKANKDNKQSQPVAKTMIPIGRCHGLLFGQIHFLKDALTGPVEISYDTQRGRNNQKQPILNVSNSDKSVHLGQCDNKLVAVFADFLRTEKVQFKAKIIDADLTAVKKRLPANRFVRKLEVEVSAQHDAILSLVEQSRKKVKNWKWANKEVILRYFEGEEVNAAELYDHVINSISVTEAYNGNLEQLEANFNAVFEKDITAEDCDGIDPYDEIVTTKLLEHQRIGIQWMSLREKFVDEDDEMDEPIAPFYKEFQDKETGEWKYVNLISEEEVDELPDCGSGGILADDMGLGKTLQCISLIATNSGYQNDANGNGPTLIVAPLTVIGNWVQQIEDHCAKNSFRIMVYHGPNREKDLEIIQSHHIVITTFDIVALEYSDENEENREEMRKHYGCGLQYINWLRVVLDEAHKIHSRKTRMFKACHALQSKSRWCLTGTPVQNRLDDLYSLFCFLKLQPICDKAFWNKFVIQPLKNGNSIGFERLRKIMKQLCLRRDKSMKNRRGDPIIQIPEKHIRRRVISFLPEDRKKYEMLMAYHKEQFKKMSKNGDKEIMRNFSSVLSMLLRLRQACAHMALVPELNGKSSLSELSAKDLNIDTLEDANQECASCGMTPESPTLTTCNHVYCNDCFMYELEINNGTFPCTLCGEKLTQKSIAEQRHNSMDATEEGKEDEDEEDENEEDEDGKKKKKRKKYKKFVLPEGRIVPSTKMHALITDIKGWAGAEVGGLPNKAVVFSQWTSVLDLLARCLDQEEILYERLDGSMSRATREAAMDNFRKDDRIPVFLMSLKAGNLGVNMTVANHVYMLDPWWNPATEDQAVDRVYRLGQKRNVTVNHFVIENSVEEKILTIQERKRKLIRQAMCQSKEELKDARKQEWLDDLKDLFTVK